MSEAAPKCHPERSEASAERTVVRFRMGGVVCLGRDESGAWALEWMLVPELAGPQAG